ncbi:MAG: hypothetical protein ACJ76Y_31765 [Thermoanaerobaculia bacterium]
MSEPERGVLLLIAWAVISYSAYTAVLPMARLLALGGLAWFLLEVTTALTNQKRRALHDLIAGTVVVREE